MQRLIIFDFEVFKYDTLLGALIIDNDEISLMQTWDLEEIKNFYYSNINSLWLGWNNERYDNHILQAIIKDANPFKVSKEIIEQDKCKYLTIQLNYYDLMTNHLGSLKAIECSAGKNIHTTDVDFNLNRKLTIEEKELTESYNFDDLEQTLDNFISIKGELSLRMDVISEFDLPLSCLHVTGTQLAEKVLHAESIPGIENWIVKPIMYPQLHVKNKEVINFYMNEDFRKGENITVKLCDVNHNLGSGGIHGARKCCHEDWAYYFDVSGYYNLIMILLGLLPRTIPDQYKEFYKEMYEQQLILKKTNPGKRWVYKVILLSVFGAMTNKFCKFYDPNHGTLVTMVGQMFLVDLLEKLEGKVKLIQSNTDGVVAKPLPGIKEEDVVEIINEWQTRTGFVLKLDKIYDIHQRDVNNYMYKDEKGNIHVLGEAVKYYNAWKNPLEEDVFRAKEPAIIHHCIVEYFINKKLPEEVIEENKKNVRMFQYCCRPNSFDYLEYQLDDLNTGEVIVEKLQSVNRAFAMKAENKIGMIYKRKYVGKTTKAKISNLPDSVFVYNDEVLSETAINKLVTKIDYSYYIRRGYERILEFIDIPIIKKVNV